jgi:hypothetical protein
MLSKVSCQAALQLPPAAFRGISRCQAALRAPENEDEGLEQIKPGTNIPASLGQAAHEFKNVREATHNIDKGFLSCLALPHSRGKA